MEEQSASQFCITVEYDKQSPHPEQVFLGISRLIESFNSLDGNLVSCIDNKIEPLILLEDIEKGSIKVWLKNTVKSLPDEGLKNCDVKRIVGEYLVKTKYLLLSYLEDKSTIDEVEEIERLEQQILDVARATNVSELECYTKPPRENLLKSVSSMGESFSHFRENDRIYLETANGSSVIINKGFRLSKGNIEQFCAGEILENTLDMLLKVRKPDFLGDTQWSFRHGKIAIDAKILDEDWLKRYRNREIAVYPGDSLKVKIQSTVTYGKNSELISQRDVIIKVFAVVPGDDYGDVEQITCLPYNDK